MVVSKSRKPPGAVRDLDLVLVEDFERDAWRATYRCREETGFRPSSDTPLLWHALIGGAERYGWTEAPQAALHGHAIETVKDALDLGIPISEEETRFSTPPDLEALEVLFRKHPYPG